MDAVFLSRLQFGVAAGFHFLFPPLTLGMTLFIFVFESLFVKSGRELYKSISSFLIKILGLIFVLGVATGIVLEFSFGTNWSTYSRMVGSIFGAVLAVEGMVAFFIESVFLGLLLFGRNKVSGRVYWAAALIIFIATHLSGLMIIVANSWMQTPAGYALEGGRAVITDFYEAVFNPSTLIRFFHTVIAAWMTGAALCAGIASFYLLKKKHEDFSKSLLRMSLGVFIALAFLQFVSGHSSSVQVAKTQPAKLAAFEALWKTTEGAPLAVFGIPVESEEKTYFEVSIPKLLSFGVDFDWNSKIQGLDAFPKADRPPVFLPYVSYHVMIGLGSLFALIAGLGIYLFMTKRLYNTRWYLAALVAAIPLPHIANQTGWIVAEVGRQPWAVYGVLRTRDAASVVVPAGQILFSLIMFSLIYLLLFAMFVFLLTRLVGKGPANSGEGAY